MLSISAVNPGETKTAPGPNHPTVAYDGEEAGGPGRSVDVFDRPIVGQTPDSDDLDPFLLACHSHIGETIHEDDGDRFPADRKAKPCQETAQAIESDKLRATYLHNAGRDCRKDKLNAAE